MVAARTPDVPDTELDESLGHMRWSVRALPALGLVPRWGTSDLNRGELRPFNNPLYPLVPEYLEKNKMHNLAWNGQSWLQRSMVRCIHSNP